VIFADRPLAVASTGTRLRRRLAYDIAVAATVILCAAIAVFTSISFVKNRRLVESTRAAAVPLLQSGWDARNVPSVRSMEELRKRVLELGGYDAGGAPFTFRWGMYSGDDIFRSARTTYDRRLREFFLSPSAQGLRRSC